MGKQAIFVCSFMKEMYHAPNPCRHELGAWYKQAEGFA